MARPYIVSVNLGVWLICVCGTILIVVFRMYVGACHGAPEIYLNCARKYIMRNRKLFMAQPKII